MARYIARRLLYMILVFFLLTFVLFSLYQLMPANRAYTDADAEIKQLRGGLTPAQQEIRKDELYLKYQRLYGTDTQNVVVLYLRWLGLSSKYTTQSSSQFQIIRDNAENRAACLKFVQQVGGFPVVVKRAHDLSAYKTLANEQELDAFIASDEFQAAQEELKTLRDPNGRLDITFILEAVNCKRVPSGIFEGDFGYSYDHGKPVVEVVPAHMRNSFLIGLFTEIAVLAITIPLGIKCAVKKGSRFDRFTQIFTLIGFSTPSFIIYIIFIVFFCSILGWFPVSGMLTPGANYTGFRYVLDLLWHVALPTICLTFGSLASITRITRASMIDALNLDCIRTARAKGLSEKVVIYSHAWRNALVPMVAIIVGGFFNTISGAMILEQMFGFKGMGLLFLTAVRRADYDMIMFLEVIYTFIGLFSNLVIDLCYGIVDPRVRISK